MAYIGIGYIGTETAFLKKMSDTNSAWLNGDRIPRFFGDNFIVLYDSNTAREFVRKCRASSAEGAIVIYTMDKPLEQNISHNRND
jgi:hypothetical protein